MKQATPFVLRPANAADAPGLRALLASADLYERLVARARERGLRRLFLLTTAAAPYFAR